MRIALYHNLPSGGALRVLYEFLKHQGGKHEIELFVPDTASDFFDLDKLVSKKHVFLLPPVDSALEQYRRITDLPKLGRRVAKEIDSGGFDVALVSASQFTQAPEVLPYLKTPSLYYAPEYFRAIYDRPPPSDLSAKEKLKRIVLGPYDRWRKRFDRRSVKSADRVMAHSKFARARLKEVYGVRAETVYLGVDSGSFTPGPKRRKGYVLSVGALHPLKGHDFVIDALATIPEKERPKCVVVGDRGDYGPELARKAREQGVELEVRKNLSHREVIKLYREASVLAAAQRNEPFGLITLEAMACATPVVAVKEGGLAETVKGGKTGLLTGRNPKAFGDAVRRVLRDRRLAERLGRNGIRESRTRWQWSRATREIEQLLERTARTGDKKPGRR